MKPSSFWKLFGALSALCWLDVAGADFSAQFERIKTNATKAQLYTFL